MIFKSRISAPNIPTDVFAHDFLLDRMRQHDGKKVAIIDCATNASASISDIDRMSTAFAPHLPPGTVVLTALLNSIEYAVTLLGTWRAGCTMSGANPLYTPRELQHQMQDCGASVIVTNQLLFGNVEQAVSALPRGHRVTTIYVVGSSSQSKVNGANVLPFDVLLRKPTTTSHMPRFGDPRSHLALIPYSSGTTGVPKGVMISHYNMVALFLMFEESKPYRLENEDLNQAVINFLPFFHVYGCMVLIQALSDGNEMIAMPRFDFEKYLELVQKHRIRSLYTVPPIVTLLAKHPIVAQYDLTCVSQIMCGAAPLGRETEEEVKRRIPSVQLVSQGYGMTEMTTACFVHMPRLVPSPPGSCGLLLPTMEAKIIDDNGNSLSTNQRGELCVRGPIVCLGYINRPGATNELIDPEGWLHTGDIAYLDENENLFVVDRRKELIKYKGFQVAPAELETLLLTHTDVSDAAVIGIPDEMAGERPKAFIVLKQGKRADADGIKRFIAERVAVFKRIEDVEFVKEIPKSQSGKILRRFLRDKENAKQNRSRL